MNWSLFLIKSLDVDIRAILEKEFYHIDVVQRTSFMQRRTAETILSIDFSA
jgi:BMFP domain-containing protein YqiC